MNGFRWIRAGEHVQIADVLTYAGPRCFQYERAFTVFLSDAFDRAVKRKLVLDRKTWKLSDRRLGVLSQPVNLSEWPECDLESAVNDVCRSIWSNACRAENLEKAGLIFIDPEFGTIHDSRGLL